jgi:DNA polymerase III epsilon subunit-like protein
MPHYTDVMVDIETTGTRPDAHAIIQIAAVQFNVDTMEINPDFFNQCLSIPPTRHWDEGTRQWWSKMPTTLNSIYSRMQEPRDVMSNLFNWAGGGNCGLRFWSKPLSFDFMFVASYFNEFGPMQCFNHSTGRDLRTFMAGLAYPGVPFDEKSVQFEGVEHDGLFDTLHQIKILFAAIGEAQCKSSKLTLTAPLGWEGAKDCE